MLKLKNISKYYKYGKNKKVILDNISIDFKKREMVFILGTSGSGKSTLLNIIAGNLKCDSGEIYLDNSIVSKFSDRELDNYRRGMIGNIFQDYNLIEYMSVIDNVMLGSVVDQDSLRVDTLLRQLGIYDKKEQIVSKLSGGEKQRVAIARAMINDPEIILCDEPTGALDSANGIKVMEILKKISKNKLVIVVSHDNELAMRYADRIVRISDGKIEYAPLMDSEVMGEVKKSKIKFGKIVKLAFRNLMLKKGRTLFTSLAISLGIVSIMIVLCLSGSFKREISDLEKRVVSMFPISIRNGDYEKLDVVEEDIDTTEGKINIKDDDRYVYTNRITKKYIDYVEGINEISNIVYDYEVSMPFISDTYRMIDDKYLEMAPSSSFIIDNYEIVSGREISNYNEVLIKIDSNNSVSREILNYFDIDSSISYEDIIGRKIRVLVNDIYYEKSGEYYYTSKNNEYLYDSSEIELVIVGVVKEMEVVNDNSLIFYDKELLEKVFDINRDSLIVLEQLDRSDNVLGLDISKSEILSYLGYDSLPIGIDIYVDSLSDKERVIEYLDEYNDGEDSLIYEDMLESTLEIVREFISIISIILVMFSLVAMVISSLMVGILTNVRVLERKKEIGIFRSLGASKRDVRRLFDIENVMIGMMSSVVSLLGLWFLVKPINSIMNSFLDMGEMFRIDYVVVLGVVLVNIVIVRIAGGIPSRIASKMEIVKCIYNR